MHRGLRRRARSCHGRAPARTQPTVGHRRMTPPPAGLGPGGPGRPGVVRRPRHLQQPGRRRQARGRRARHWARPGTPEAASPGPVRRCHDAADACSRARSAAGAGSGRGPTGQVASAASAFDTGPPGPGRRLPVGPAWGGPGVNCRLRRRTTPPGPFLQVSPSRARDQASAHWQVASADHATRDDVSGPAAGAGPASSVCLTDMFITGGEILSSLEGCGRSLGQPSITSIDPR